MKFVCERNTLLKEVSIAQEIISVKNAMSILSNILLEVQDNFLNIKATDLKVVFETKIPVSQTEKGTTTVFCEKFLGILRSLPETEVEFQLNDSKLYIRPIGTAIDFQLRSISSDKFPELQLQEEPPLFELVQSDILEMINQTIFSVSDDEARYYMNGVYLEIKDRNLVMVATDGRRLAYIEKEIENELPKFPGVIIPPKPLNLIRRLSSGQGNTKLAISEKQIFIYFDNQKITSNLIEGQFPNYAKVIPESQNRSISLQKNHLLEALKRVSLLSEQRSKRVFLTAKNDNLIINTEENEMGMAKEEIPCNFSDEPITIALNYSFVLDPLKVMDAQTIALDFTDPKKAITLRTEPKGNAFHVIMPMQID